MTRPTVIAWQIVISEGRLELVDSNGVVVDTQPITRRGERLLSSLAFERGADQVRFNFDLKLTEW